MRKNFIVSFIKFCGDYLGGGGKALHSIASDVFSKPHAYFYQI